MNEKKAREGMVTGRTRGVELEQKDKSHGFEQGRCFSKKKKKKKHSKKQI